ncbi:hypothetical protein GCM10009067_26870 [Haloarcula sebkhae]|uniref:Uncharacterized protein n=1 Tax=Haloarcula sebkhae TaxID=932660 RepID=A0A830F1U3_9EURY|nr:hypothetical protein GCM10009067_26870 [Haloarcula sebkhae]
MFGYSGTRSAEYVVRENRHTYIHIGTVYPADTSFHRYFQSVWCGKIRLSDQRTLIRAIDNGEDGLCPLSCGQPDRDGFRFGETGGTWGGALAAGNRLRRSPAFEPSDGSILKLSKTKNWF